ncbi:hypothetical protein BJQ94_16650 [Cryobacterium sp. SO2]|uniref:hypothetical protein n=1 Tax=Cryobacterium sp. SO2 TaxID=1897060 RepID=UPI00223D84CF|nr:hypothetical protein [Cryobacterium sp. SO2]WEO76963.1 hypothetical protein BJQ94_16650 [Cryobacterium sp. SO2]
MTTRWARFARGWIVAGFSTFVAALSHTLGGGAVPGPLAVVVSLAFAGIVSIALSGRTLSTWRLTVAVLLSQLIFHGLFSFGGANGRLAASEATAGHLHGTGQSVMLMPATGTADTMAAGDHGLMMTLAHVLAAVVTVVALRHGERAFWGLFATASVALTALVRALVLTPIPSIPRSIPALSAARPPRDLLVLLSPMRHRGPPVRVFA